MKAENSDCWLWITLKKMVYLHEKSIKSKKIRYNMLLKVRKFIIFTSGYSIFFPAHYYQSLLF